MAGHSKKLGRSALLLVDFINHFQFEDAEALKPRAVKAARVVAKLKKEMAVTGHKTIYVNDNFGKWNTEFSTLVNRCLAQGGASAEIAQLLRPTSKDLIVLKPRHSGFYGTPLEFLLQEIRVSTIVITGIVADRCVIATAADAHTRKFSLRVPANCVAGFSKKEEMAALSIMKHTMDADTHPYK